eukprot:scaffold1870_cov133-Chaetoceros_neogracile.AAC.1
MRRNSIVLVLLGIVCLSASVVQAARLRSRKSVTKNTVEKKISNHETNGDNHELQEQQNLTVGRKLERKKMRVHKHSAELEKKRTWRRNQRLKKKQNAG